MFSVLFCLSGQPILEALKPSIMLFITTHPDALSNKAIHNTQSSYFGKMLPVEPSQGIFQKKRNTHLSGKGPAVCRAPSQRSGICRGTCLQSLQVADPEVKPCPIKLTASSAFVQGIRKCQAWVDFQGESPVQNKEGFFLLQSNKIKLCRKGFCWERNQGPERKEDSASWINEPNLTGWSVIGITLRFSTWVQKASW